MPTARDASPMISGRATEVTLAGLDHRDKGLSGRVDGGYWRATGLGLACDARRYCPGVRPASRLKTTWKYSV